MNKAKVVIILIMVVIGLVISLSLLAKSFEIDISIIDPICKFGDDFDCVKYMNTNWSHIFGLSQSILTTVVFSGMLLFFVTALFLKPEKLTSFLVIPFIISIFNFVYSLFNVFYMFILKGPPYSLPSVIIYALNIIILVIMIVPYLKKLTDSFQEIFQINIIKNFYIIVPVLILIASIVLGIILNNLYFQKKIEFIPSEDTQSIQSLLSEDVYEIDTDGALTKGTNELGIEIIIFDDFQCSACIRTESELEKLMKHYNNKIKFVFKHYPLESECFAVKIGDMHIFACEAAWASMAANEQGKFWEYHSLLFSKKIEGTEIFENYAEQLGLDIEKFNKDYKSEKVREAIKKDVEEGYNKLGLTSTPSIFFNKRRYMGRKEFTELVKMVEYLLSENKDK